MRAALLQPLGKQHSQRRRRQRRRGCLSPVERAITARKPGRSAKIATLLKRHGYLLSFQALSAGNVVVDWYYLPRGAHLASHKLRATDMD